ncbi:MAG: phospholipase D-like domain-containing protein [Candidatus Eremiobacteraeota bacterium]|nr:phospholipase D-like domain-containing protein [Candidatus Eremiobacteraeota bacterium]
MLTLTSTNEVLGALASARRICFTAYLLHPGRVLDALADAARNGARVTVRLDGQPYADHGGSIARANAAAVAALRAAGADAAVCDAGTKMHMKAVVVDGVAYLDDRNFNNRGDTIVRDDSRRDIASLRAAFANRPWPRSRTFWTNKGDALAGEARLLQSAPHTRSVDVQTESFDASNAVCAALQLLAARGVRCRLIVSSQTMNAKELRALHLLQRRGVAVHTSVSDDKLAIVGDRRAWVGSSNATSTYYDADQKDWGLRTNLPTVTRELQRRFQCNWKRSDALRVV